ncbi:NCS2 family permease [Paenibacillus agri]|uniref:NCS2 family permease n=1 Tax=Paenibacillus agri TaxID=2744309 RepID=A0A850EKG2_9BACL|nr:NCS2 family permease [Paenibacillus agri]NUU59864.1 NCS2 family permease [Paenibacillus agri]
MKSNFWRNSVGLLPEHDWKREWAAGILSYFASVYIVMVNAAILHDAGMPLRAGMVATLLTAITGCLLMAFAGKTPIIVVPGMGINAFFTYTLVHSMKLDWREALAVVVVTGILFAIVAFTSLYRILSEAIPHNLQHAITVGIGLFLTFIGLQKSGIVIAHQTTFVAIGHFSDPAVITSCITLLLALVLFIRGTSGGLLISMAVGTGLAYLLGATKGPENVESGHVFSGYSNVFFGMQWTGLLSLVFWIAIFLLLLIVVFENIGLIASQTQLANRPERFKSSLRALSIANIAAGIFGSSPVVAAAESNAGIAAGGRSGLTSLVTGILFGATFLFIPLLAYVPDSAIAPILMVIGGLMVQSVREMDFSDMTELFPAFLVMVMIPFTYSIVDGMAFGFITYPILKLSMGKGKDVPPALYAIAALFVANFILHALL